MISWGGERWLFSSGNEWRSANYATGQAACPSMTGPCTRTSNSPLLTNSASRWGPGGASPFTDTAGRLMLAYHWRNPPYTDYPDASCIGALTCTIQGPRRLGITALLPQGGPLSNRPFGAVDSITPGTGSLTIGGWGVEPVQVGPIQVHV